MRVSLLTLNVDGLKMSPSIRQESIFEKNPDLYVEFTQEDARDPKEKVALRNGSVKQNGSIVEVPREYTFEEVESLNPTAKSQNIITKLFSRVQPAELVKGSIPVKIKESFKGSLAFAGQKLFTGYSKGAVYIYVKFPMGTSYLFINCHLPINTKKNNYGYNYRKSIFEQLLSSITQKFSSDPNLLVVVGGDLNFRYLNQQDQLNTALQSSPILSEYTEFPYLSGSEKAYTCKFKYESSEECRLTPFGQNGKNTSCRDEDREPSRCDRFLYKGMNKPTVEAQYVDVLLDESDHNAVFLTFSTPKPLDRKNSLSNIGNFTNVVNNGTNVESVASDPASRPSTPSMMGGGKKYDTNKHQERVKNIIMSGRLKTKKTTRSKKGTRFNTTAKVRSFLVAQPPQQYKNTNVDTPLSYKTLPRKKNVPAIKNTRKHYFKALEKLDKYRSKIGTLQKYLAVETRKLKALAPLRQTKQRKKRVGYLKDYKNKNQRNLDYYRAKLSKLERALNTPSSQ